MLPQKKKHKRMDTRFGPEKGSRGVGPVIIIHESIAVSLRAGGRGFLCAHVRALLLRPSNDDRMRSRRHRGWRGMGTGIDDFEPELMDSIDGDVFGFRGESEEAILERVADKNFFNDFPDDFNDDDLE